LLKEADFEYLLTQTFSCISEASAKTLLERQEKSMMETGDEASPNLNS
jgi:type IV secretion system protein VirB4